MGRLDVKGAVGEPTQRRAILASEPRKGRFLRLSQ
jgi:hypothetical protein